MRRAQPSEQSSSMSAPEGLQAPLPQMQVARQIASRLTALLETADDARLGMLAYLIDMARAEAERKAKAPCDERRPR